MHHDTMVAFVASSLLSDGFEDIRADLGKFTEPEPLTWTGTGVGYVPDVTARKGDALYIYEVETADSIDDPHTEAQWKLFAKCAADQSGQFTLVVPQGTETAAKARLRKLGIDARLWPVKVR